MAAPVLEIMDTFNDAEVKEEREEWLGYALGNWRIVIQFLVGKRIFSSQHPS
jgi:hypothetical protein